MSSLKTNDKQILEKTFRMEGGGVLNFSNRTLEEFFSDNLNINIYDPRYDYGSGSKANRMRRFWVVADNWLVGKSIAELIEYINTQILLNNLKKEDFPESLIQSSLRIAKSLGANVVVQHVQKEATEEEFLSKEFDFQLERLSLESALIAVLQQRVSEIRKCLHANAPLSVIFLCGSTLEGILLGVANRHPHKFNSSNVAPKREGKVLLFHEWKLAHFIDVSRDIGFLGEDVKKYSHALRGFRNYIHPYEQMSSGFNPHEHTAKISWQVLQAAIYEISQIVNIQQ